MPLPKGTKYRFRKIKGGKHFSGAAAPTAATTGPAAQVPGVPAQPVGGPGRIAQTLGVTDPPPPNQLLTKAIKPLASNTGWDSAIAKAAPDMKAVEAEMGHPITGVDDALSAVNIAKKGIWKQYAAKQAFPNAPNMSTIDGNEIADAMIGRAFQAYGTQPAPAPTGPGPTIPAATGAAAGVAAERGGYASLGAQLGQ
jgi:hypothetical protein